MTVLDCLQALTDAIAHATCHGLDARSFVVAGRALPYCARCTGLLWGIVTASAFLCAARRTNASKPPSAVQAVICGLLWLPLALDAGSSYLGLRETTNALRFITGVCFTAMLPGFAVLLANYKTSGANDVPLLRRTWEIPLVLAANGLFGLLMLAQSEWVWVLLSALLCGGMIWIWSVLLYAFLTRVLRQRRGVFMRSGAVFLAFIALLGLSGLTQLNLF